MILDNLTRAFKTQNWLAVATEFVIVIAGVVIGFQINGWAEARERDALVRQYIDQMQTDLASAARQREEARVRLVDDVVELNEVHRALDPASGVSELSEQHCRQVALSHLMLSAIDEVPAIDQIITSGQRELIIDEALNRAITRFLQQRRQARDAYETIVRSPNILPNSVPSPHQKVGRGG